MTVAQEIKGLTSDPGARKAGEYLDTVLNRLAALEQKVADCCDHADAPVAPPTPPTPPTS